jgi:hypothetical protein
MAAWRHVRIVWRAVLLLVLQVTLDTLYCSPEMAHVLRGMLHTSQASHLDCTMSVAVDCGYGYYTTYQAWLYADQCLVTESATRGFHASIFSAAYASGSAARQCVTGYYAEYRGYILAENTNAKNNGNVADYNPAVSDAFGNHNGSITWS